MDHRNMQMEIRATSLMENGDSSYPDAMEVQAARETEQYREEQASISELHIQSMMQLPPQVQHEAKPTIRRSC